jgi:hypothetical protein
MNCKREIIKVLQGVATVTSDYSRKGWANSATCKERLNPDVDLKALIIERDIPKNPVFQPW